jgi:hypothetical protein
MDLRKKGSQANSGIAKGATPNPALACTIPAASAATRIAPKTADEVRKLAHVDACLYVNHEDKLYIHFTTHGERARKRELRACSGSLKLRECMNMHIV